MTNKSDSIPSINMGVEGIFRIQKIKDGDVIYDTGEFKNLILDYGLDTIMNQTSVCPFFYCRVGTGTTSELASQTDLVAPLQYSARSAVENTINTTDHYLQLKNTYTFSVGSVVGNITEIGVGKAASGNTLFSRVRIRDTGGNPTSISILADEQLIVYYYFRLYQPTGDMFTGTVGGYDVIMRAANINALQYGVNGWTFGSNAGSYDVSDTFKGSQAQAYYTQSSLDMGDATTGPYNQAPNGSYGMESFSATSPSVGTLDITFTVPTTKGVFGTGIRTVAFGAGPGAFQCQFDPPIPKTVNDRVILTFRLTLSRRA